MKWDDTIGSAAVATIIATTITTITTLLNSYLTSRKNERKGLSDLLLQINSLTIEYPYFEDDAYIVTLQNKRKFTEKELRYNAFCTIVFNYLEGLFKHHCFNSKKVAKSAHYKEIIKTHQIWWSHPYAHKDNLTGYDKRFIQIVNDTIAGSK